MNDIKNGISLDQEVASRIGSETRFASLVIGGGDVAWNRRGVRIPSQQRATQVFKQLFIRGTPQEEAREMRRVRDGQSILDDVRDQVKSISGKLGEVEDIGYAALFLATDEAKFITGQTIVVDGGQTLPEAPSAMEAI